MKQAASFGDDATLHSGEGCHMRLVFSSVTTCCRKRWRRGALVIRCALMELVLNLVRVNTSSSKVAILKY